MTPRTNPARTGVTWAGLDELGLLLRSLPDVLQTEAGTVIAQAAQEHYAAVNAVFPAQDYNGNLRRGNRLEQTGPLTWRVRNTAPHSHLYERGYLHVSGRQVDGHDVWVPAAQDIRARMVSDLERLLARVATRSGVLEMA